MLEDDLINHAVLLRLLRIHDVIAVDILFNAVDRLARVLRQQLVDRRPHAQNFLGVQIDVGGLAPESTHPRLVDQYPRIGKRKAFFGSAANQQNRRDRSCLTHAGCNHVRLHELHRIVNCETRGDRAPRRINVQLNILFGVFRLQEKHLSCCQIGDMVINGCTDENNVLFQEARVNVVRALPSAGLFNNHRNQGRGAVNRIIVVFHVRKVRLYARGRIHLALAAATVLTRAFCASQSTVLSLRSFAFILSSAPCFVKRARIASADSPPWLARCSNSCWSSSSVTSICSSVAMRSTTSSAFTSSLARSSCRRRRLTQSTLTARGSTPCCARERTTRSRRTSI